MAQDQELRTVGFFNLPRTIRDDIYRSALIAPHPLFLFQESPSRRVECFAPDKPVQWPALLLTSHQLHIEAREVFYGWNRFNLVDTTTEREAAVIQSYLTCIGSINASLLSHLCISFPAPVNTKEQPGKVILGDDGLHSLQLLQEKCTNLKTLEAYVHRGNSKYLVQASLDRSPFVREILSQVDGQLKAIPSLGKIVIRFYDGPPTPLVKEVMQGLGWTVFLGDKDNC